METIYLLFFTVLFAKGCLNNVAANGEQSGDNATSYNFKVANLTLNLLNLIELLDVAKMNSTLNVMACDVFRQKYRDYWISLRPVGFRQEEEIYSTDENGDNGEKYLAIRGHQLNKDVLQYFGNCINKLEINNPHMSAHESKEHNKMANENGSGSIIALKVVFVKMEILEQYTKPWSALEELSFGIWFPEVGGGHIMPFDKLMPKIRKLTAEIVPENDYSFMDYAYPNIEYLNVDFIEYDPLFYPENPIIDNMVRKNRQIKNIDDYRTRLRNAKLINTLFPSLQNVTLSVIDTDNETVCFTHAKQLNLLVVNQDSIDKLSFPRLESIYMYYKPANLLKLNAFFEKHQNVQNLTVYIVEEVKDYAEIVAKLPNLIDISFLQYDAVKFEQVTRIIQDHRQLKKFEFWMKTQADVERLSEQFRNLTIFNPQVEYVAEAQAKSGTRKLIWTDSPMYNVRIIF